MGPLIQASGAPIGRTNVRLVAVPPPPTDLPPAVFTGGMARRGGWQARGPFARLEFDAEHLAIKAKALAKALGLREVRAARATTQAIRLSTGVLAVRVSVIQHAGTEVEPYFATMSRRRVRQALVARGWPVVEDRWRFARRPADAPG
jgi:hypothetical protein